jgi:HPt (histidine-containing phosphotransfer) domain-containing protein
MMNVPAADKSPLVSELAGDPELGDLVELFVAELPAKTIALTAAFETGKLQQLQGLAHQLKGSAGGYGFAAITDAAKALESVIKEQCELAEVKGQLDALVKLCSRATSQAVPGDFCARESTGCR